MEAGGALEPDRIGAYLARQRRLRGISLEELICPFLVLKPR